MSPLVKGQIDNKVYSGMIITLGLSMLTPEYIAPFFVFVLYIIFIKHFKSTQRNAKLGNLGKVFLAYTGYMLLSSIWSSTHFYSVLIALLWMGCLLTYILTANILNTEQKIKNAITALNISTGIIGLLGALGVITYNLWLKFDWWNFIFPNPFYYEINDAFFNILPVDVVNYRFRARASSTFDNPLILATYLVTTTPFCAFGAVHFEHKKSRKISRYCLVGGLLGIVFTASRGAYIAIALAILVLIISGKKIFKKLFPFIISLGIAIPIGLTIRYNTTKVSDFIESDSKRLSIWQSCIKMFQQHPIFGMGAGTENIHLELQNTYGIDRTHAHNLFLEMLVEGGIIGGIFVVAIIVILIKNITAIFRMKNSLYRKYAVLYTSSLLSFTVISMFEFTLQSAKELMILFILLGFIEATYRMVTDTIQLASDEVLTYEEIPDTETQEQIEEKTTANV